jgi:glycosyltransferase involved in cell wall biosynthesis
LLLPILFHPEPWNGIMEHLRLLATYADQQRYRFILAIRPGDGGQTRLLAERAALRIVDLGDRRLAGEIRRVCRDESVDLVHIHTPSTAGVAKLALGARLAGARAAVSYHQVQPARLPVRARLANRVAQAVLLNRSTAVSLGVAETLAAHAGLRRDGISVIPNGVAPAPDGAVPVLPREDGTVWFGYFGRLAAEKGLPFLIDGFAEARAAGAPARLVILGEGYEREALERQVREAGIGDAVDFKGYQPDARAWMRSVDVVVHVPEFEGFGLALIEAMEAGKPVIASRVPGGIAELVNDGENGCVVGYPDVSALAGAICEMARDAQRRATLGAAGRARFERLYTAESMVARIASIYDDVLR